MGNHLKRYFIGSWSYKKMRRLYHKKRNIYTDTPKYQFTPMTLAKIRKFNNTVLTKAQRSRHFYTSLLGVSMNLKSLENNLAKFIKFSKFNPFWSNLTTSKQPYQWISGNQYVHYSQTNYLDFGPQAIPIDSKKFPLLALWKIFIIMCSL